MKKFPISVGILDKLIIKFCQRKHSNRQFRFKLDRFITDVMEIEAPSINRYHFIDYSIDYYDRLFNNKSLFSVLSKTAWKQIVIELSIIFWTIPLNADQNLLVTIILHLGRSESRNSTTVCLFRKKEIWPAVLNNTWANSKVFAAHEGDGPWRTLLTMKMIESTDGF